ncbi:bifunctional aminoglycoside phosphotransferase/ATP-binding protein [Sphingomonas sp. 37zxx]|uniref:bifunctional aminoglycoside phosphotransferase/ATP-binding protein n=1 Tax=Sphingomonas sp. 37zxx TaxID=1550073 RepID=UPI000691282F|nr:AAA family ATPase [Sphingomonas sp. 37zxx]
MDEPVPSRLPPADAIAPSDAIAFFRDGAAFGGAVPRHIATHAAHVFLADDRAWKLKRAVRFDYLDFSTIEKRKAALENELHLNRRTAPDLYLQLHPITRSATGGLRIGGDGAPIDWALEMRRFADDDLLLTMARADRLTPALVQQLADEIAAFHQAADVSTGHGASRVSALIAGNAGNLARYPETIAPALASDLIAAQLGELAAHADLLDQRAMAGRVRHGHGDLHLANIALFRGKPILFDCLEFSDDLATVDLLYDLAFLVMDLLHIGLPDAANMLANRYLDRSPQDEDGWCLFPLFLSVRATVRAHVEAAAGAEREACAYFQLACDVLQQPRAHLLAIGGRSGAGKSTLAKALASSIGAKPGARVLRSDVLRKQLAGIPPETRLAPESYTVAASGQVYRAMMALGERQLGRNVAVILDAAFLNQAERTEAAAMAAAMQRGFTGLWLEASEAARIRRVADRIGDASDATPAVVSRQSSHAVGSLEGWHMLDATQPLPHLVMQAKARLDLERA